MKKKPTPYLQMKPLVLAIRMAIVANNQLKVTSDHRKPDISVHAKVA